MLNLTQEETVYQLKAVGHLSICNGSKTTRYSSTVFTTKEKAEQRFEKFKAMVTDPKYLDYLDPETVEITATPLTIVE